MLATTPHHPIPTSHVAPMAAAAAARALLVVLVVVVALTAAAILAGPAARSTVGPDAAPAPGLVGGAAA